jgi:hypothetical protein
MSHPMWKQQNTKIFKVLVYFGASCFQTTFIIKNVECIQFKIYERNVHCYQVLKPKLHIPLDIYEDVQDIQTCISCHQQPWTPNWNGIL